jgi:hypothetical protein
MSPISLDTLCNKSAESVLNEVGESVAEWNGAINKVCDGIKVIVIKSYGRIYLRWYVIKTQQRSVDFKALNINLGTGQQLELAIFQQKLEHLNAQIALHAKRQRQFNSLPKPA